MKERLQAALKRNHDRIRLDLLDILRKLGLNAGDRTDLAIYILNELTSSTDLVRSELDIFKEFSSYEVEGDTLTDILTMKMSGRAKIIFDQIQKHLTPVGDPSETELVDFGCGDAQVTALIHSLGINVSACDIDDYRVPETKDIPFCRLNSDSRSTFLNNQFGYAVATNVFHHAVNNDGVITEIRRIMKPGGKLVVIETVPRHNTSEDWDVTLFFDYLYNRVFHDPSMTNVPVPGTYELAENWPRRLESHGFKLDQGGYEVLGFDQELIPDWHVLYVFTLRK